MAKQAGKWCILRENNWDLVMGLYYKVLLFLFNLALNLFHRENVETHLGAEEVVVEVDICNMPVDNLYSEL